MMDTQKTTNGLQVIGEGTGIGKSTLHMVGYLGKVSWNLFYMCAKFIFFSALRDF